MPVPGKEPIEHEKKITGIAAVRDSHMGILPDVDNSHNPGSSHGTVLEGRNKNKGVAQMKNRPEVDEMNINGYSKQFRKNFGQEWDKAVSRLKRSGRNLNIPIAPEQKEYTR